jgi:FkbM family methyltransferase
MLRSLFKLLRADDFVHGLPEGRLKRIVRVVALQVFSTIPRNALANTGDTVLHAGVWRTETMEEWAEVVGPDGHVIIVEADPQNAEILDIERTRRNLDNVTVVNKAVWNEPDEIEFLVSDISCRNKARATETYLPERPNDSFSTHKMVPADTIDNIVAEVGVGPVDHVHTEISGAELEAIEGMAETLDRDGTRLWMRAIHLLEDDDRPAHERVVALLEAQGLSVYCAKQEPDRHGRNVYAINS